MKTSLVDLSFYSRKRVLVSGHTGFKGAWLCAVLAKAGAEVFGYALTPPTTPSLYQLAQLDGCVHSRIGDIRDFDRLNAFFDETQPEIVLHLAAQPIVRTGYREPRETYETNLMGTVNMLECVRQHQTVRSFLNVTTDKVYLNNEQSIGFTEEQPLDGYDPYSNSKSCSELATHSYQKSFFADGHCAISTARAGNVIGGGDFAPDRIIPDCVRAALANESIFVRNPSSTRPYQHVLEPLFAYLLIAEKQWSNNAFSGWYNVGPDDCDCVDTGTLVSLFCDCWGEGLQWRSRPDNGPHEAQFLKLDCAKLKKTFQWTPRWHIADAIARTVEWTRVWKNQGNLVDEMNRQIASYAEA